MPEKYVGLMSGTSLDGIDAVLASFDSKNPVTVHDWLFEPYEESIHHDLEQLLANPQMESDLARKVDEQLGIRYAQVVNRLLADTPIEDVRAIGCHGQTILHSPQAHTPFTWQAGDSSILATRTGIPVVSDFRTADMRAGGQGAPLAPAFHLHAFRDDSESRAVVNIGGIANATYLPAGTSRDVLGFDTGPGNALSDQWIRLHKGLSYDQDGRWAASGRPDEQLLTRLMSDSYFSQPAPKSLDSRQFSLNWLLDQIRESGLELSETVIQSTLAAFTARTIWLGIQSWMPSVSRIYLCGGGAHNLSIAEHLRTACGLVVVGTDELGIPPDQVEACAFAWLAKCYMDDQPANLPSVTGADQPVRLGVLTRPNQSD